MGRIKEMRLTDRPRRQRRPVVYLVCEGKETEIKYFRRFRTRECLIDIVPKASQHKEALSLVQHAKDVIKQEPYYPQDGDMVWCVFDRDDNTNGNLSCAEQLADQLGYRLAYSNPSFELWFLLHFRDQQAAVSDADSVIEILRKEGYIAYYEKSVEVYDLLISRQSDAVDRAERRIGKLTENDVHVISRESNPVTTVPVLVRFLNSKR